jgi:PhnB protein
MASVSTYLNFPGTTEEAFAFYKSVFGTDYVGPINRMGDAPPVPGAPPMSDAEKKLIMHIALPILAGHVLHGTDTLESMGHKLLVGNNFTLNLAPDTRAETDALYVLLSEGGKTEVPLMDMFWGAYFGLCVDKFGVRWMFNCEEKKA